MQVSVAVVLVRPIKISFFAVVNIGLYPMVLSADNSITMAHLRFLDQLSGLAGSLSSSKSRTLLSSATDGFSSCEAGSSLSVSLDSSIADIDRFDGCNICSGERGYSVKVGTGMLIS